MNEEITLEMIENTYAHIPPRKGLFVPYSEFCAKFSEMWPGAAPADPTTLQERIMELAPESKFTDAYCDTEGATPVTAVKIGPMPHRITELRHRLFDAVSACEIADPDGWCNCVDILAADPGISEAVASLGFSSLIEAVAVWTHFYEIHYGDTSAGEPFAMLRRRNRTPREQRYPSARNRDYGFPGGGRLSPESEAEIIRRLRSVLAYRMSYLRTDDEGWGLFAQVGNAEIKNLLRALGYLKVRQGVEALFGNDYELRSEEVNPGEAPVVKIRSRVRYGFRPDANAPAGAQQQTAAPDRGARPLSAFEKLRNFALFMPPLNFKAAVHQLAQKALHENWYFGKYNNGSLPILNNYLTLTFERLLTEDEQHADDPTWHTKIRVSADSAYAVFNTGLVDRLYEPVYAFFSRNINQRYDIPWFFIGFVESRDPNRQLLTRIFGNDLPEAAHYYNSTSELLFDVDAGIGYYNWDHIIGHCERMPISFLRENVTGFDFDRYYNREFFAELSAAIRSDEATYLRIKNRLQDAIDYALRRVRWNFKTAVPIYYPAHRQLSLLLPLELTGPGSNDVALVLEAADSGTYIAHTILSMKMAYNNARLITRPDSDWLLAPRIHSDPAVSPVDFGAERQ